jgi:hypothetical protein
MKVAITNISTVVSDADVQLAIAALQIQVTKDFLPIWDLGAELFFLPKTQKPDMGVAQLIVADTSDQAGALGYHELTVNGDPIGYCFAKSDIDDGTKWSITLSHELLEMLADPGINQVAEVDNQDGSITFYAYEVCDACEGDQYGYVIKHPDDTPMEFSDGSQIYVSDFVTPEFFMSPAPPNVAFDVRGQIQVPLQILPDGYLSVLQVKNSAGWQQLTAEKGTGRVMPGGKVAPIGSRRMRRQKPDAFWLKSKQ